MTLSSGSVCPVSVRPMCGKFAPLVPPMCPSFAPPLPPMCTYFAHCVCDLCVESLPRWSHPCVHNLPKCPAAALWFTWKRCSDAISGDGPDSSPARVCMCVCVYMCLCVCVRREKDVVVDRVWIAMVLRGQCRILVPLRRRPRDSLVPQNFRPMILPDGGILPGGARRSGRAARVAACARGARAGDTPRAPRAVAGGFATGAARSLAAGCRPRGLEVLLRC